MKDKRYHIEKLADILTIPDDRMDAFFVELRQWVDVVKGMDELAKASAEAIGLNGKVEMIAKSMDWIDDDKGNITVKITTDEKEMTNER